jgi:hypothetical protein
MRTPFEQHLITHGYICKIEGNKSTYLHIQTEKIILFIDGNLINPTPRISSNGTIISHIPTISDAIRWFDFESVIEAMFNKKITLVI